MTVSRAGVGRDERLVRGALVLPSPRSPLASTLLPAVTSDSNVCSTFARVSRLFRYCDTKRRDAVGRKVDVFSTLVECRQAAASDALNRSRRGTLPGRATTEDTAQVFHCAAALSVFTTLFHTPYNFNKTFELKKEYHLSELYRRNQPHSIKTEGGEKIST